MLKILNKELKKIFEKLNFNQEFAFFVYSNRPDISDFQTNCAMPLAKSEKKSPIEIAEIIVSELKELPCFDSVSINAPGFINVKVKNDFIIDFLNTAKNYGYENNDKQKVIVIDYGSPNVAKELHIGHLRSAAIGECIKQMLLFNGDKVIGDNHLGDWGTNMGMVIEGIRHKYPQAKCFQEGFNDDKITDMDLKPEELLELYQYSNVRAKDDKAFFQQVQDTTKELQDGNKAYRVLWKYFWDISVADGNDVYATLNTKHDVIQGESFYHEEIGEMVDELTKKGILVESEGAKVVDITDTGMPPLLVVKSNGAYLYQSTDLATLRLHRRVNNPDINMYVVDFRQSLHFKQLFESGKRCGYLDNEHTAEHIVYGTINGKDGKPFKTRSGGVVKLRDVINDTIEAVKQKSSIKDIDTITNIAIACLKFADLLNYRESDYIFDIEQFTNFEGKTGAYLLYTLVRIKSIFEKLDDQVGKLTIIKTKEERDLILELTKFGSVFKQALDKRAPHYIVEYVYNIAKNFSTFYSSSPIATETEPEYKASKIAILNFTKQYILICFKLLAINEVEKM
ncbi:MAG: arginine--tRNA ligase [Rickettsiales bacterium]|nr:MAG: arginine--tRNA ligase [Rickettsiales bacterium]